MAQLLRTSAAMLFIAMVCKTVDSYYISADYYMDPTQSDAFGGVCDDYVTDESMFISSHMNPFNLVNYGRNKNCRLVLDAGITPGARYRMRVMTWQIELPDGNGTCHDYLTIYDGYVGSTSTNASLAGVYCGMSAPNITDIVTQRHVTFFWITDSHLTAKGFRILAIRTEPPPCSAEQFHCQLENRCIASALQCDGTDQCDNGSDEMGCTGVQRFVRVFLRVGLSGIVAVGVAVIGLLILLVIVACCVKCIKQNKVSDVVVLRPDRFNGGRSSCHSNAIATEAQRNRGDRKLVKGSRFVGVGYEKSSNR